MLNPINHLQHRSIVISILVSVIRWTIINFLQIETEFQFVVEQFCKQSAVYVDVATQPAPLLVSN